MTMENADNSDNNGELKTGEQIIIDLFKSPAGLCQIQVQSGISVNWGFEPAANNS